MEYVYAAMLLQKLGNEINEKNIRKIIEVAGGTVDDAKVRALVASLEGVDIDKVIKESAITVAAAAPSVAKIEEKKEEKKIDEKKSEEQAAAGLGALFG